MTYPRNRTRDLRLTRDQYRRHRYRVARGIGWVVLVAAVLWVLWTWMRPAQADVTPYSDGEWRTRILRAYQLESPRLPALAWSPPGTPTGQAELDAWLDANKL